MRDSDAKASVRRFLRNLGMCTLCHGRGCDACGHKGYHSSRLNTEDRPGHGSPPLFNPREELESYELVKDRSDIVAMQADYDAEMAKRSSSGG